MRVCVCVCEQRIRTELGENELDISGYLIMPIQRIPRYILLLEDFRKHTKEDHPDYESLGSAIELVKKVAQDVNEAIRIAENMNKLIVIQARLQGCKIVRGRLSLSHTRTHARPYAYSVADFCRIESNRWR